CLRLVIRRLGGTTMARTTTAKTTATATALLALAMMVATTAPTVHACGAHGHHHEHHVHVYDHDHTRRHLEAKTPTTAFKCPACRMSTMMSGYNNANYVQLKNGQRVYTCGMDPRTIPGSSWTFETTDTAYVGANMAEYIVNKTATKDFAACKNECPECADGIKDPVTGDAVTTSNFRYVCVLNGQKIYFASDKSKNEYLSNVNKKIRYLVDKMVCSGAECADALKGTELSVKAASMVPDLASATDGSSAAPTPAPSSDDTSTSTGDDDPSKQFCVGKGSVMLNGFQLSINGNCVRLFFQPWVLNSKVKYAFGFLGIFFMALFNEYLAKFRERVRQGLLQARRQHADNKAHKLACKLLLSVLYMVQMTIAYFAMLVVMMYESVLFLALILGFGAGFLSFKSFDMDVTDERGAWRYTDPSTVCLRVGGMKCMKNCGSTVEVALQHVPGVTKAVVIFEEHCAYVAGSADVAALVEQVEAVGFSAEADIAPISQHEGDNELDDGVQVPRMPHVDDGSRLQQHQLRAVPALPAPVHVWHASAKNPWFYEYLAKFRERVRQHLLQARREHATNKMHKHACKLMLSVLYMVQMTIAYFAMLVVMMYESVLFLALILGFGAGFLCFKSFDMDVTDERGAWRYTDPSGQVPGVTKAVVIFEEQCAYVAGTADVAALVEQVEAMGYSAEADTALSSQRVTVLLALALAATVEACADHGQHGHDVHVYDHTVSAARQLEELTVANSTTAFKCPVCRMSTMGYGYNNTNYVQFQHCQRLYTCGMLPRKIPGSSWTFDVTDTSYLGANVAEFVVNKTDVTGFALCKNECPECADGIKDPVSGDTVASSSFHYVCLSNGQKIYFASHENRNEYLTNVNKKIRYLVAKMVCSGAECSDAFKGTELSAKAAAMVPDLSTSPDGSAAASRASSTNDTSTATGHDDPSEQFCVGKGSVMLNGFQLSINGNCVKLFFRPWVLNSKVKYAFGFLGIFFMALFNEYLAKFRERVRQHLLQARREHATNKMHKHACKLLLSVLYMVQMTIAYFAMLVVMMYESVLFLALILGFGAGFLCFKSFDMDVTDERGAWRYTDPSTVCLRVGGMKCMKNCGSTVEAALQQVPGVTKAVVIFEEQCAYVAGTADVAALVEQVEAVGFSTRQRILGKRI
ncbi:TPA: hypothetical protein N0F65_000690, partial [Lagenidium giganteum]